MNWVYFNFLQFLLILRLVQLISLSLNYVIFFSLIFIYYCRQILLQANYCSQIISLFWKADTGELMDLRLVILNTVYRTYIKIKQQLLAFVILDQLDKIKFVIAK